MDFTNIRLDKHNEEPLYRQLAAQLKNAIITGTLRDGERLPPIRAWKDTLGVSSVTATQAYEVLAQAGFTSGQVGRGTFVKRVVDTPGLAVGELSLPYVFRQTATTGEANLSGHLKSNRAALVQRYLQNALAYYQANPDRPTDMINMTSGSPAPELFELRRWKSAMMRAGESFEQESLAEAGRNSQFQYGSALGDNQTREWLADYLARFGFQPQLSEVMLTSGSQQSLDLLARVFMAPGETLLVESPTYFSALEIFESQGVNWLPVSLDREGMRLDEVERLAERHHPRLLYIVPTSQSPTGAVQPVENRARLLELARRYNFFIIEDDTCNELYFQEESLPALKHFDTDGRVIYLKSFSKLIFPAVRLGAIVAAEPVLEKLSYAKGVFDRYTSLPTARSVLKFCTQPAFERELNQARHLYRTRRDAMLAALERELAGSGCRWTRCEGGFSLLLTLPRPVRAEEFHRAAAERGLAVLPGAVFYPVISEAPDDTLRISFGDNPAELLNEAARRLSLALTACRSPRPAQVAGPQFVTSV